MSFISNDGIRIHYEVEGNGQPLVLQHGLSDSIEGWYEFGYVERLKDEYQLIMIDARGHGQSGKPHDAAAYDLKLMASDVLAVLDRLHLAQASYSGNSLGCRIGFELAKHAPKRIHAYMMGGYHPYFSSTEFFRNIFKDGLDAWVELLEAVAGPLTPATRERLMNNDIAAMRAVVTNDRPDISEVLPTIKTRCRLFAGSEDDHYEKVKQAASELPNGDFVPLFGLNHFQAYLRGDLVAPLLTPYIILLMKEVKQSQHRDLA
ncbi:MAG: alpha/beta fold hydrolase [Pseudomonadales bacterium]